MTMTMTKVACSATEMATAADKTSAFLDEVAAFLDIVGHEKMRSIPNDIRLRAIHLYSEIQDL